MEEINFHNIPTEILEEEINRRLAVINLRKQNAYRLLVSMEHELGVSCSAIGISLSYGATVLSLMCFIFFLVFALTLFFKNLPFPPFLTPGAVVSASCFLVSIGLFLWFFRRNRRVITEFQRRHPTDAKLLGLSQ